jgi:hypothetical protein
MFQHLAFLTTVPATVVTSTGSGWGVAPVVGFLTGGLLIFMSIRDGRKAKASLQWPSVPGTVLSSELVVDTTGEIATYTPVVTYSYVVNGQALRCSKVRCTSTTSKKVLAKYPRGGAVQVFFDPQVPSTAVLEKGGGTSVMMFAGVAVVVAGCLIGLVLR